MTKKVYIERIEDPRGLAEPAEVSCQGGSRVGLTTGDVGGRLGGFQARVRTSGNIQGTWRRTFREHSGNMEENMKGTFSLS
jgi:hypothetical protein